VRIGVLKHLADFLKVLCRPCGMLLCNCHFSIPCFYVLLATH
jgi:hypothetical protein